MLKSPRSQPNAARVVEVLVYPAVQLLDVTGPVQVFASANDIVADAGGTPPYLLRVVAKGGQRVIASAGIELASKPLPRIGAALDTLMIAGGPGIETASTDLALVKWVRGRANAARRVASVCTGAFMLAASGVLDGRRAATHWSCCAELARRFPAVRVESDPIFVRDGPIWTSAGVTAGIDLALALVEEDLGRDVALAVARYLQPALCRGDRADAGPCRRTATRGRSAAASLGIAAAGEANLATLRLRLGRDHAPQLSAPARHHATGLSRPVQYLNGRQRPAPR